MDIKLLKPLILGTIVVVFLSSIQGNDTAAFGSPTNPEKQAAALFHAESVALRTSSSAIASHPLAGSSLLQEMAHSEIGSAPPQRDETTTPLGVKVTLMGENLEDSDAKIYFSTAGKMGLQDLPIYNILSIGTCGVQIVYAAAILDVLEAILNDSVNENAEGRKKLNIHTPQIKLNQVFKIAGTTSTSSLLVGGLYFSRQYTALRLSSLVARQCYTLFVDEKTSGADTIYSRKGFKDLLAKIFGTGVHQPIREIGENLHLIGFDATHNIPVDFSGGSEQKQLKGLSSDSVSGAEIPSVGSLKGSSTGPAPRSEIPKQERLNSVSIGTILETVSATPGLFSGMNMVIDDDSQSSVTVRDGLVGADPGWFTYRAEAQRAAGQYTLLSIGMGFQPSQEDSFSESELKSLRRVTENRASLLGVMAFKDCCAEVGSPFAPLTSFAHLCPKGEKVPDWDDASSQNVRHLVRMAFRATQGEVFKNVISSLGFKMPDKGKLDTIQKNIFNVIFHTFPKLQYSEFDESEKEWFKRYIIEMVAEADFTSYAQWSFNGKFLTHDQKNQLLVAVTDDMSSGRLPWVGRLLQRLWGGTAVESDTITRGFEFFNGIQKLTTLTQHQMLDGKKENFEYIYSLYTGQCELDSAPFKYPATDVKYTKLMARIFWDHMLKDVKEIVGRNYLWQFQANFLAHANEVLASKKSSIYRTNPFQTSREYELTLVLGEYMEKLYGKKSAS